MLTFLFRWIQVAFTKVFASLLKLRKVILQKGYLYPNITRSPVRVGAKGATVPMKLGNSCKALFLIWIKNYQREESTFELTRKYPLRGYLLGVLTHTTAWDRLWGGDVFKQAWNFNFCTWKATRIKWFLSSRILEVLNEIKIKRWKWYYNQMILKIWNFWNLKAFRK